MPNSSKLALSFSSSTTLSPFISVSAWIDTKRLRLYQPSGVNYVNCKQIMNAALFGLLMRCSYIEGQKIPRPPFLHLDNRISESPATYN